MLWTYLFPIFSLASLVSAANVLAPRFKWGQTKDIVFLSFMVRDLEKSSISISLPDEGVVSFKASSTKGTHYSAELPLREDVELDNMKWELLPRPDKWGDAVLVTLHKKHQHRWDMLVSNPTKFKSVMDRDWSREDQSLEPDEELPYVEDNEDVLTVLTDDNLDKTIKQNSVVVANLRYPWCSDCKSQDETFVKAAKEAKKRAKKQSTWKKVIFGVIDAREQRKLAREFGARCDHECKYKVFTEVDEPPVIMESKWSDSELLSEVSKYTTPAVEMLKTVEDANKWKEKNTTCIGSFTSETSTEYKLFKKVAGTMRGELVFAAVLGKESSVEVWPLNQNFSFKFDGTLDDNGTILQNWIRPRAIPLLQEYDWQMRGTYEKLGLPIAKVWINDKDKNPSFEKVVRHGVRQVAKKFIGKIAFVELKKSLHSYELRDYGMSQPEVYPAFGIASNGSYSSVKYAFETASEVDSSVQDFWANAGAVIQRLTAFCEKVLDGSWPEAHESGAPQIDWTAGQVKKLVWKTYNQIESAEKPLLLEVSGKYRSEHERKQKEVEHLATVLKPYSDSFAVGTYDTSDNYLPSKDFKREKYSSDTEWFWVPKRDSVSDKAPIKKLMKPKKDASIKQVLEFVMKQVQITQTLEEMQQQFEQMMLDDPPPTTTPPPSYGDDNMDMEEGDYGDDGMGGFDGMADMGMGEMREEM